MPGFDIEAARKEGYSDDEILSHLTESRKFDVKGAIDSGYSKQEIIDHLSSSAPLKAPAGIGSGLMGALEKYAPQTAKDVGAIKDLLTGLGSGVFNTIHGTGQLLGYDSPYLKELAKEPETPMGKLGRYVEQGAEYLIPGMGEAKGALLLRNAPKVAQIAGRALMGAGGAAGVAALQSGGDPEAVRNAALLGGAIPAVTGAGEAALPWAAKRLEESALTQYARVLAPAKEKTKAIAEKIRPEMLKRGEWATSLPRMLENTQSRLRVYGQQIDDAWQQMSQQGVLARVDPLLNRLDDFAKDEFYVQKPSGGFVPVDKEAEHAIKEVDAIKEHILNASDIDPATGERVITSDAFRKMRQFWDKVADQAGAFQKDLPTIAKGEIRKEAADIARSELAAARPDLAALNKEFSFLKDQESVVRSTLGRRVGQQKPLTRVVMRAAGVSAGAHGGPIMAVLGGVGMEALQTLVSSAGWGTLSAVTKNKLAESLAAGSVGASQFYLNQLLKSAGMPLITDRSSSDAKAPALPAAP